jgi:glutathione S-transferase
MNPSSPLPALAPTQTRLAERSALLAAKRDGGWALKVMEEHLGKNDFFVGAYSIADIALFAYTHVAHEGGRWILSQRLSLIER